ncbi:MAG: hypothetical protein AAF525_09825 [Pseudomonadota bacterium]
MTGAQIALFVRQYSNHVAVLVVVFMLLLTHFDRNGYEGDDLESIVPMFNLTDARNGLIDVYRYDWQPLAYQLGALVAETHISPTPVFLIAPLSVAGSIFLIFLIARHRYQVTGLVFLCLLTITPEIWLTGLYYSSTAPAMLMLAMVFALVFGLTSLSPVTRSVMIGLLFATSCLFRLDFALIGPLVYMIYFLEYRDLKLMAGSVASGALIGLIALWIELVSLSNIIEIYLASSAEVAANANEGGWDRYRKTMVQSTIFSPLGFVFVLIGLLVIVLRSTKRDKHHALLLMLAALPIILPLKDLLSPKYVVPWLMLFPLFGSLVVARLETTRFGSRNRVSAILAVVAFSTLMISIEPIKRLPFLHLATEDYRPVTTHDGVRSWGAYWWLIDSFDRSSDADRQAADMAQKLLSLPAGTQAVIIDNPSRDSFAWRQLQIALRFEGFAGKVRGRNVVEYELSQERSVMLVAELIDADTLIEDSFVVVE